MPVLQNLISRFDCIGWVPTIRGTLSLEVINDARSILGDVDKYSVKFKKNRDFHSEHYVVASSLLTTNDSKAGSNYVRTFRYIFLGSINNPDVEQTFLDKYHLADDNDLSTYMQDKGLLLGRMIILIEESRTLTDLEVSFLTQLKELTHAKKNFDDSFNVLADSMEVLEAQRSGMFTSWQRLCALSKQIETDDKNPRPTFCFDVALTRDGILLLKDDSLPIYRSVYATPGTDSDYTTHIPIHRLFKVAMNYVKYLFHSNYHHNDDHDTYLPASNLHPAKAGDTLDLHRVFRHQLDAFLVPVIKLKRSGFSSYTVEAEGVILYAKAFIHVFEANGLVDKDTTSKALAFCGILEEEVRFMTSRWKTIVTTLLSQHNISVLFMWLLTFVFTCLKLITIFVDIPRLDPDHLDNTMILYDMGIIGALGLLGYVLYIIPRSRILRRRFKLKWRKHNWMLRNSNLDSKKFSFWYGCHIDYHTLILRLDYTNRATSHLLLQILWLIALVIVLGILYLLVFL